jgi:hypothetical protein
MSKDEYYSSQAARLDTIIGGDTQNIVRLTRCKEEWDQLAEAVPVGQGFLTFPDYIREYYGIKLAVDSYNGGVSINYDVIDEKKYTVFLLKFNA